MFNYSKRTILVLALVVFAVLVVVIGGGLFIRQYFLKTSPTQQTENLNDQNQNTQTAGWKTYTNTKYGFEFKYPQDYNFSLDKNPPSNHKLAGALENGSYRIYFTFANLLDAGLSQDGKYACEIDITGCPAGFSLNVKKHFSINGLRARIVELGGEGGLTERIEIVHEGNFFEFYQFVDVDAIKIDSLEKISSTFKFTERASDASSNSFKINGVNYNFTLTGNSIKIYTANTFLQEIIIGKNEMEGAKYTVETIFKGNANDIVRADEDVNFDGHKDLGVLVGNGYGGVNYFYNFYLFNSSNKTFTEVDELKNVCNPQIQINKKQIYSSCKSGPGYEDTIYKFVEGINKYAVEKIPVIYSVSPTSATVGASVQIFGRNFAGFEGDLNLWIESSNGVKGIIYGNRNNSDDILINFILPTSVCQTDNSYSGLPCSATMQLIPGNYKIFVMPWGNESNEIDFVIK